MTNTQSPAPGVAADLKAMQDEFESRVRLNPLNPKNCLDKNADDEYISPLIYAMWMEFIAGAKWKAGVTAFLQASAAAVEPDADMLQVIDERDRYHEVSDDLAAQIATITGQELGEHSSINDPWRNAMLAADEFIAQQLRDMLTTAPPLPAQVQEAEVTDELIIEALAEQDVFLRRHQPGEDDRIPEGGIFSDATVEDMRKAFAYLASRTPAPGMAGGVDLAQWEKARFGYFDANGAFIESATPADDDQLPKGTNPRWVGGMHDIQLLRAALLAAPHPSPAPQAAGAEALGTLNELASVAASAALDAGRDAS